MTTLADHIRLQASADSVKKSKELFHKLSELVGVTGVDTEGYFIRCKEDPKLLRRVLWSQKQAQEELDNE